VIAPAPSRGDTPDDGLGAFALLFPGDDIELAGDEPDAPMFDVFAVNGELFTKNGFCGLSPPPGDFVNGELFVFVNGLFISLAIKLAKSAFVRGHVLAAWIWPSIPTIWPGCRFVPELDLDPFGFGEVIPLMLFMGVPIGGEDGVSTPGDSESDDREESEERMLCALGD
jgi:hypothetical protein